MQKYRSEGAYRKRSQADSKLYQLWLACYVHMSGSTLYCPLVIGVIWKGSHMKQSNEKKSTFTEKDQFKTNKKIMNQKNEADFNTVDMKIQRNQHH